MWPISGYKSKKKKKTICVPALSASWRGKEFIHCLLNGKVFIHFYFLAVLSQIVSCSLSLIHSQEISDHVPKRLQGTLGGRAEERDALKLKIGTAQMPFTQRPRGRPSL